MMFLYRSLYILVINKFNNCICCVKYNNNNLTQNQIPSIFMLQNKYIMTINKSTYFNCHTKRSDTRCCSLLTMHTEKLSNSGLVYISHLFLLRYQNKSLHFKIKQYTFLIVHHSFHFVQFRGGWRRREEQLSIVCITAVREFM